MMQLSPDEPAQSHTGQDVGTPTCEDGQAPPFRPLGILTTTPPTRVRRGNGGLRQQALTDKDRRERSQKREIILFAASQQSPERLLVAVAGRPGIAVRLMIDAAGPNKYLISDHGGLAIFTIAIPQGCKELEVMVQASDEPDFGADIRGFDKPFRVVVGDDGTLEAGSETYLTSSGAGSVTIVGGRPLMEPKQDPVTHPDRRNEYESSSRFPDGQKSISADRQKRPAEGTADITLINLALLYVVVNGTIDQETHVPLGPLYLTSSLEQAGFTVDFVDHQVLPRLHPSCDPFDIATTVCFLGELAPVIGISCMANLLPFSVLLAKELKRLFPEKTIVLGGVGPFAVEAQLLAAFPWFDVIVRGEAEHTIVELLRALRSGAELAAVPGIFFRAENGNICQSCERERIRKMETIPLPAYSHIDPALYDAFNVITSRGCPYRCSFCSVAPVWRHRATQRSHSAIIDEIRFLHEQLGVKQVLFQDEFFYGGEAKMIDFLQALSASGLPVAWKCFGRVNLATEGAMARMADAGCTQIRFGIESGSDRVLGRIVKGFDVANAADTVTRAARIFPSVETFFIWGFPFESSDDFLRSVMLMLRFRHIGVNVLTNVLSFLPQTELYRHYQNGGYAGKLQFRQDSAPSVVATGHEVMGGNQTVPPRYQHLYDLVADHPEIFPGFSVYDHDGSAAWKRNVMRKLNFT